MAIKYIKGDATNPGGEGQKIIVHICNDVGGWGKGFVLALSQKWTQPEQAFRSWFKHKTLVPTDAIRFEPLADKDGPSGEQVFRLGQVQFVQVETELWVANMIAQHDLKRGRDGTPPIRYGAMEEGLLRVRAFAKKMGATVHMPRIGAGLAGGNWPEIEEIINKTLVAHDITTTVYELA